MQNNRKKSQLFPKIGAIALCLSTINTPAFANTRNDGLQTKNGYYSLQLDGVLKIDQREFFGDKDLPIAAINENSSFGQYYSGGYIRDLGLTLSGDAGANLTYNIGLAIDASSSSINVDDAYLTYAGRMPKYAGAPSLSISVGQVNPGFCLESAQSSKWTAFMERSLDTNVFGPCPGLGVSFNTYNNWYSLTAAFTQPKASASIKDTAGNDLARNDRWQSSARVTFVPYMQNDTTLQFGLSGHYDKHGDASIRFSTEPEMRSRNYTTMLDTNTISGTRIAADSHYTFDLELSMQHGPLTLIAEGQRTKIQRGSVAGISQGKNLHFDGYHVTASYVMTGEKRARKLNNGTFGQVISNNPKRSAVEASVRYSFLNLNDQDINGGSAHNMSYSLSWYLNKSIRVIAEYVNSKQERNINDVYLDSRTVESLGTRLQIVF